MIRRSLCAQFRVRALNFLNNQIPSEDGFFYTLPYVVITYPCVIKHFHGGGSVFWMLFLIRISVVMLKNF